MPRQLFAVAAVLALSTAVAQAQGSYGGAMDANTGANIGAIQGGGGSRSPEQRARDEEIEKQYNETIRTKIPTPAKKGPNDPWASVRTAPPK